MPDRSVNTIFGIPARIVGSAHWTDEEFQIYLDWTEATNNYARAKRQALIDARWVLRFVRWYEGRRETSGTRARHPEHSQDKEISFDEAVKLQKELTPEAFPECPKRPPGLPSPKLPLFETTQVSIEPMSLPAGSIFHMSTLPPKLDTLSASSESLPTEEKTSTMLHRYYFFRAARRVQEALDKESSSWQRNLLTRALEYDAQRLAPEVAWRMLGLLEGSLRGERQLLDPREEDMDVEDLTAWLREREPQALETLQLIADEATFASAFEAFRGLQSLGLITYPKVISVTNRGREVLALLRNFPK